MHSLNKLSLVFTMLLLPIFPIWKITQIQFCLQRTSANLNNLFCILLPKNWWEIKSETPVTSICNETASERKTFFMVLMVTTTATITPIQHYQYLIIIVAPNPWNKTTLLHFGTEKKWPHLKHLYICIKLLYGSVYLKKMRHTNISKTTSLCIHVMLCIFSGFIYHIWTRAQNYILPYI